VYWNLHRGCTTECTSFRVVFIAAPLWKPSALAAAPGVWL
jgi:hypothetical protein